MILGGTFHSVTDLLSQAMLSCVCMHSLKFNYHFRTFLNGNIFCKYVSYMICLYDNSSRTRLEMTCMLMETMIYIFNEEFSHLKSAEHKKVRFTVVYWNIGNLGHVLILSELIQFSSPLGRLQCACIDCV